jgi:hypothetical protein
MIRAIPRRLGGVVLLALLVGAGPVGGDQPDPRPTTREELDFVERHWRRPIPPQGDPPSRFTPVERALDPRSCGTCHPAQLADWKTSLHARSMGPGLTGQLVELERTDPDSARLCLGCHAPLAEQQPEVATARGFASNRAFAPGLQRQGLVCAACHVRQHARFGPPPRDGATAGGAPAATLPHGGATRASAFLRSEFCSSCHQFPPDGFALNGKLLENTFAEWKASPAARKGLQCQHCHMPDRRHLWRGIHDPEMVASGIEVSVAMSRPRYRPGQEAHVTLTIANTGVGHHFPTYVTPRVIVRAELIDAAGRPVPGSGRERIIGREVALDLSREISDTRIPAGGRFTFAYRQRVAAPGVRARVTVTVQPDHFYTRFFESTLEGGAGRGEAEIRQALEATRRSPFVIYRRELPLT